jgi:hypothetical protein
MRERSTFHGSYRWKRARRVARIEAEHTCSHCGRFVPEPGALHVHHRKSVKRAEAADDGSHAGPGLCGAAALRLSGRRVLRVIEGMVDRSRSPCAERSYRPGGTGPFRPPLVPFESGTGPFFR